MKLDGLLGKDWLALLGASGNRGDWVTGRESLIGLSPVWRFGGLLLLINGGLAIGLGRRIYQHAQPGWWLLIWPLTYLVGAIGWLPQYTWYLAIVYLCLSYVSYGLAQTHKQIRS